MPYVVCELSSPTTEAMALPARRRDTEERPLRQFGVLTVRIPKSARARPRRVEVQSAAA
jgi:hypothetical protein